MKQHSAVERNSVENEALREALKQHTNEPEKLRKELEVEAAPEDINTVALLHH
jgi:hypothetical protein